MSSHEPYSPPGFLAKRASLRSIEEAVAQGPVERIGFLLGIGLDRFCRRAGPIT